MHTILLMGHLKHSRDLLGVARLSVLHFVKVHWSDPKFPREQRSESKSGAH